MSSRKLWFFGLPQSLAKPSLLSAIWEVSRLCAGRLDAIPVFAHAVRPRKRNGNGFKPLYFLCRLINRRMAQGAKGRNWLFFGEQYRATDFLYEDELIEYHKRGLLHGLDLAFSRDQPHKIYVQHRMRERSRELWEWIQNGAYFYVCGDAKHMAKDVHLTLIDIAQREGGLSAEAAGEYVNTTLMKTEKRYLRDVY